MACPIVLDNSRMELDGSGSSRKIDNPDSSGSFRRLMSNPDSSSNFSRRSGSLTSRSGCYNEIRSEKLFTEWIHDSLPSGYFRYIKFFGNFKPYLAHKYSSK